MQRVEARSTLNARLLAAGRLAELGVTRVVMETTPDCWKPVFYLVESRGLDPWLVNARDVKHLPGRPKTDRLDAGVGDFDREMNRAPGCHWSVHAGVRVYLSGIDAISRSRIQSSDAYGC